MATQTGFNATSVINGGSLMSFSAKTFCSSAVFFIHGNKKQVNIREDATKNQMCSKHSICRILKTMRSWIFPLTPSVQESAIF